MAIQPKPYSWRTIFRPLKVEFSPFTIGERVWEKGHSQNPSPWNDIFPETLGKVRCHLLSCVIALTRKRLLELKVKPYLGQVTAEKIIEEMRTLDSLIVYEPGAKKPRWQLENLHNFKKTCSKPLDTT